jgi:UDP-glucose 4-epimerase
MTDPRHVWVTGASGFLGAAVCMRLAAEGYVVRPLGRSGERVEQRLREAAARGSGDVFAEIGAGARRARAEAPGRMEAPLLHDLARGEPDLAAGQPPPAAVVHFAAEIPGSGDPEEAEAAARRNLQMDGNVFAFAAAAGAAVVFASSGSVYGPGRGELFVEDGPTAPQIPYARAKLDAEARGAAMSDAAGVAFAALRISAPYGPGQRVATVTCHFLTRALAGQELRYHGAGTRRQDFVYVDDVAAAVGRCVAAGADGVFNIASGTSVTMKELALTVAELVAEATGDTVDVVPSGMPDAQEGLTARYAIDAARRAFGWRPETDLRDGLARWRDRLSGGSP